jgi:hypothetical protein
MRTGRSSPVRLSRRDLHAADSDCGPKAGSAPMGSRRAATGVRDDRGARPKTVEENDLRSRHRRPLTWCFSCLLPGPQHHAVPCRNGRYRSRTEEARGSNPLTSTPPSHQLRAHGAIRFRALIASLGSRVPSVFRRLPLERFEENSQTGKGCTALDQHQVRTWTSWYRWTTLVMLGHLLLVAATIIARAAPNKPTTSDKLNASREAAWTS